MSKGSSFRVSGSEFRVRGSRFKVQGSPRRVPFMQGVGIVGFRVYLLFISTCVMW